MTARSENTNPLESDTPAVWIDTVQHTLIGSRRIRELITARLRRIELGESEFSLLWLLGTIDQGSAAGSGRAISQREIARRLAISAAQVCGLVERLRIRGLICGRRDRSDRRRQCWRLTDAGEAIFRGAIDRLADWTDACERAIGPRNKSSLDKCLMVVEQLARQAVHDDDSTETNTQSSDERAADDIDTNRQPDERQPNRSGKAA